MTTTMSERLVLAAMNELRGWLTLAEGGIVVAAMEHDAEQLAELYADARRPELTKPQLARDLLQCARLVLKLPPLTPPKGPKT